MSTVARSRLTAEEYLEIERRSETKSEFYQGEMFPMVGASYNHSLIELNVGAVFREQLKGGPCRALSNDMRVKVPATGLYTYPDVIVVCGKAKFDDDVVDTLLNPKVLVEILSESTEAYDRGRKFEHYRSVESFTDYLLIAQDKPHVEHYTRQADGRWLLSVTGDLDGAATLDSINCTLPLREVYHEVSFESDEEEK